MDHLRAQVGHQRAGERSRDDMGEFNDLYPRQGRHAHDLLAFVER
jgi:hypothetical protein